MLLYSIQPQYKDDNKYEYDFLLDDEANFNQFDSNKSFQYSIHSKSFYDFDEEGKINYELSNIDTLKEFISKKTEPISDSFMSRHENINNNNNYSISYDNFEKEKQITKNENIITKKGRRKKNILYKEKAKHTKSDEDNIIRKIKTFIFNYITNLLNCNLKNKYSKFYPLARKFHIDLGKDINENLLERRIYEIYENELNQKNEILGERNKKLIQKIFEENQETKVIDILNKTFNEMLNYIRENDSKLFLGQIRNKEEKNNKNSKENIEEYMKKIYILFNEYEFWFKKKSRRNSRNKGNYNHIYKYKLNV